jgi:hypothetical protein
METVRPKKNDRAPKTPAFLEAARVFYADAFEHRRKKDLGDAMAEWADMDEGEQSFAVAHLLYLNLKAQADTLRVLVDVRDLLDEVADGVDQALDADDDDGRGGDEHASSPAAYTGDPEPLERRAGAALPPERDAVAVAADEPDAARGAS